jgi:Ni/Co efflux regulator RcnB
MKITTLTATCAALALAFGGAAFAKDKGGHGEHDNRNKFKHGHYENQHDRRDDQRDERRDAHEERRGAGPEHNIYQGGRLPTYYRNRGYWVDDWRGHRLSAPPPGYHWVQAGGDYVLVANSSNIIFRINLGG